MEIKLEQPAGTGAENGRRRQIGANATSDSISGRGSRNAHAVLGQLADAIRSVDLARIHPYDCLGRRGIQTLA